MSEGIDFGFSLQSAMMYNGRTGYDVDQFLGVYPDLGGDRGGESFARSVYSFQVMYGFSEGSCDGKLGSYTYGKLLEYVLEVGSEYVLRNGMRIELPKREEYALVTYEEAGGMDLHRYGNFSRYSNKSLEGVCMHWGGLDASHCYRVFASNARKVSSHFLIGLVDGKCVVYQVLDLAHKAWHAGKYNGGSVGIDICQQPSLKWKDHYESEGYELSVIDNDSGRGERRVLSLDGRLETGVRLFIYDLMESLDMEVRKPDDGGGYYAEDIKGGEYTLYCHSMVSKRKWDIAPWWDSLFADDF